MSSFKTIWCSCPRRGGNAVGTLKTLLNSFSNSVMAPCCYTGMEGVGQDMICSSSPFLMTDLKNWSVSWRVRLDGCNPVNKISLPPRLNSMTNFLKSHLIGPIVHNHWVPRTTSQSPKDKTFKSICNSWPWILRLTSWQAPCVLSTSPLATLTVKLS